MIAADPLNSIPAPWRGIFANLLPAGEIVANAARGTHDPQWRRASNAGYPDAIALSALAYEPELKSAMRQAGIRAGMRVLDAACGPGVLSRFLLDVGADEVVGLDISAAMLDIAGRGPAVASARSLVWRQGDLREPLPFPDGYFDAVWLGDLWLPAALPELRRVTRPGGPLILRYGGLVPGLTYSWDSWFEARIAAAAARGYALNPLYGESDPGAFYSVFSADPRARLWTGFVERVAPVPPIFALALAQNFGLWEGAFIKDGADPEDWAQLARLYDPAAPAYIFARPDGHFVRTFTIFRSAAGEE